MNYWLVIEPYVYIYIKGNTVILYNTINGKYLKYSDSSLIILLKKLNSDKNLNVIKISQNELLIDIIRNFVDDIRNSYIGDIIPVICSSSKPFQFKPLIKKQFDVIIKGSENIIDNLSVLNLYLNNATNNQVCVSDIYKHSYKQYTTPVKKGDVYQELKYSTILKVIQEINNTDLLQLNILGGKISRYSKLKEVIDLLKDNNFKKVYHIDYNDFPNFNNNLLDIMVNHTGRIKLFFHFPIYKSLLNQVIDNLLAVKKSVSIIFMVQSERDYSESLEMIDKHNLVDHEIIPIYNGCNINFFKENIFIDEKDIFGTVLTQKELFARQIYNPLHFGHITIFFNSKVYSNLNNNSYGDISTNKIEQVIIRELLSERNWLKTRKKIKPCNKCIYNCFCPPISNYEYTIGKYNLCVVNQIQDKK